MTKYDVVTPLPAFKPGDSARWHKVGVAFVQANGDVHVKLDSVPMHTDEHGRINLILKGADERRACGGGR